MKKYLIVILLALVLPLSACNEQKKEQKNNPSMETTVKKDFMELAAGRYSVRHFASTPVEQEKVDLILEAGKLAPTAVNSQPESG